MTTLEQDNRHSVSGEMLTKAGWNAWKRITNPVQHTSDDGHDKSMWDNNDDAFLRDVALEQQQRLQQSPSHSENALEEVSSLAENTSESAADEHMSGYPNASHYSSSSLPRRRPVSGASASLRTFGSISGSGSDASSALTFPSPGSSKIELTNRHRPNSHRFSGSHEVSPTSATFSNRDIKPPSPSFERLHEGWTEEPIDKYEDEHEIVLSSLPEERNWSNSQSPTSRRPSASSIVFASPPIPAAPFVKSKSRVKEVGQKYDASGTTNYQAGKTPVAAKSNSYYNQTAITTSPSKRASIVSGLKKLGASLKSSTSPKEPSVKTMAGNSNWNGASPMPTTDEIQIVSAIHPSSHSPIPSFSHFSFQERSTSAEARQASPFSDKRTTSEGDHYTGGRRQSESNEVEKGSKMERIGSRMFGRKRYSGLFPQSRNSSQTSFIEHTSFEEARRGSGGPFSMAGSALPSHMVSHDGNEEEREELQGDCSPRSGSPRQSLMPSPARPTRYPGSSSPLLVSSTYASRASPELSFNAAHDKRWSTVGPLFDSERRGSDVSLSRAASRRRGSDTSSFTTSRAFRTHDNRDLSSSTLLNRTSWHKNFNLDAPTRTSSLSSKRASVKGQQGSQRVSELIGNPLSRKQSLTGAQISRPTSLISTSSLGLADSVTPVESNVELVTPKQTTLEQTSVPSFVTARLDQNRQSKSAAGRVELLNSVPFSDSLQGDTATSFKQQMSAPKRPTFGLDLQPDAAAAFDSIPSPLLTRRLLASSTPTLVGLSLSNLDNEYQGESSTPSPPRDIFPCTPIGDVGDDEELLMLMPEEKVDDDNLIAKIETPVSSSPRPLPPDTPQSPVMEELELLDDEGLTMNSNIMTKTNDQPPLAFTDPFKTRFPSSLSHSRSQDQLHWTSCGSNLSIKDFNRRGSFSSRPRSSSYSFV